MVHISVLQLQVHTRAGGEAAAGFVHIRPCSVVLAFTHFWPRNLPFSAANKLNLIIQREIFNGFYLSEGQAPVTYSPVPRGVYDTAAFVFFVL